MKFDLAHWVESLKSSNAFVLASILLVLLSAVITIAKGIGILVKWYHKTVGYKKGLTTKIRKLSADTNVEYFRSLLGSPAFINHQEALVEYIFVLGKYAYVQAFTDNHGRVLAYSVTTRTRKFNPSIKLGPYSLDGKAVKIVLGKSKFQELDQLGTQPESLVCSVGAHDYYYSEKYYFGNPGNYQDYCFSLNQSGFVDDVCPMIRENNISIDHPDIQLFRRKGTVNTYSITSPRYADELKDISMGPNYNQVRVARDL